MKSPARQQWDRYASARELAIPNAGEHLSALFAEPLPLGVERTFATGYRYGKAMLDQMKQLFEACEDGNFGPATDYTLENGRMMYLQGFRFLTDMIDERGPFQPVYEDERLPSEFTRGLIIGFWGEMTRLIARADRDNADSGLEVMASHPAFLQAMGLCGGVPKSTPQKRKPAAQRRRASS